MCCSRLLRWMRRAGLLTFGMAWFGVDGSAQEVLFEIHGEQILDALVTSAPAGDVDQDGYPDFLVSSGNSSYIHLHSGRTRQRLLEITDSPAVRLGYAIDGAGDFDGDGVLDVVAGAPDDNHGGAQWCGSVRVYSGLDGHLIAYWNGHQYTGRLGLWVAGLGDVNGDGYSDVATAGLFDEVWILGGPDMHLIRVHEDVLTRASVAAVGDVDGDGRPDYVCGWPQDSTNGLWTGRATVYSGRSGAPIHTVYGETAQSCCIWTRASSGPTVTGDHLGLSVAGAGDVNGDDIPDFVVGAPGEIDLPYGATHGMVRVYSGSDASILWEWQSAAFTTSPGTFFGWRVYGGGDINGDGYDDLLVAAPYDQAGTMATTTGSMNVFSGQTGELLWKVFDPGPSLHLWYMSPLGDMNTDGLADFAMGNPDINDPAPFAGRILVYSGAEGDVDRFCTAAPNSTGLGARLDTHGPISVGNDRLSLVATGAIKNQLALFLSGDSAAALPFGDGTLCLGGRIQRLLPAQTVEPDGSVEREFPFTGMPFGDGASSVGPGSTLAFQLWYRDPGGPGGSGSNLSDALEITFLP